MVSIKVLTDDFDGKEVVFFKGGEFSTPLVIIPEYMLLSRLRTAGYEIKKKEEPVEEAQLSTGKAEPKGKYFRLVVCPVESLDKKDQESLIEVINDDLKSFFRVRKKATARWELGWYDRYTKVSPCAGDLQFDGGEEKGEELITESYSNNWYLTNNNLIRVVMNKDAEKGDFFLIPLDEVLRKVDGRIPFMVKTIQSKQELVFLPKNTKIAWRNDNDYQIYEKKSVDEIFNEMIRYENYYDGTGDQDAKAKKNALRWVLGLTE